MKRILAVFILVAMMVGHTVHAQTHAEKSYSVTVIDAQGVATELKNAHFYGEERISETAFVPHELTQVPVKRGSATVNVKFDTIREIDVKPSSDKATPVVRITLTNGKTGEFPLAIAGSFTGDSDFREVELPAAGLRKIVFK